MQIFSLAAAVACLETSLLSELEDLCPWPEF